MFITSTMIIVEKKFRSYQQRTMNKNIDGVRRIECTLFCMNNAGEWIYRMISMAIETVDDNR
jgi:hypothetical protein